MRGMSEITKHDRGGRFVNGGKPGPGRPVGSRSKLSEQFLLDLRDVWNRRGIEVLEKCCDEDPAALLRAISGLLPRDVRIDLGLDAASFAQTFEAALAMLGNAAPRHARKPLPGQPKVIEQHER
jgi:hypothetical protein